MVSVGSSTSSTMRVVGFSVLAVVCVAAGAAAVTILLRSQAPDAGTPEISSRAQRQKTLTPTSPSEPPAPATGAAESGSDFASPLVKAGAGTCASQVNALASGAMGGVKEFNVAAHWAAVSPDQRPVSVFIGQRFGVTAVPFGATGIVAAPNGMGSCDSVAVQIVPSPVSCAKLRTTIETRGKQIADLAGVPLMEDAAGQTMLVPTGADGCVLVGVKSIYAK